MSATTSASHPTPTTVGPLGYRRWTWTWGKTTSASAGERKPHSSPGSSAQQGCGSRAPPYCQDLSRNTDPFNPGLLELRSPGRNKRDAVALLPSRIWKINHWIFKTSEQPPFKWLQFCFHVSWEEHRSSEPERQLGGVLPGEHSLAWIQSRMRAWRGYGPIVSMLAPMEISHWTNLGTCSIFS